MVVSTATCFQSQRDDRRFHLTDYPQRKRVFLFGLESLRCEQWAIHTLRKFALICWRRPVIKRPLALLSSLRDFHGVSNPFPGLPSGAVTCHPFTTWAPQPAKAKRDNKIQVASHTHAEHRKQTWNATLESSIQAAESDKQVYD